MITLSAEVSAISSVSYFYVTETQRVARSCLLIDDECLLPTDMPEVLFGKKKEKSLRKMSHWLGQQSGIQKNSS